MSWYAEIADLYDGLVRVELDIPFFVDECRRARGPVLELMAGTGRVSLPLAQAGVDLTCVDASDEMLARLRSKLERQRLSARVLRQDVRELDFTEDFVLAILPFNSFAELVTPRDRQLALAAIRRALRPQGRFICTLHNPSVRLQRMRQDRGEETCFPHPAGAGTVHFTLACDYDEATRIASGTQTFVVRSPSGAVRERREVRIRFSLPDREEFEGAAGLAGLTVESLHGDYDRSAYDEPSSPFMIWCLLKH